MSRLNGEIYDAIIIGAGISGLVCGCYLAKAGMKILVVEQHDKPGGYCTSFRRQGFTFDAAAHSFGSYREGGNFRKIIKELGVDTMLKIKRFDPSDIIVTPDFRVTFWNDVNRTIDNLIDIFPGEKNNIKKYYDYYDDRTSAGQFENIKLKDKTFASFLSSYSSDNVLMNAISFPVVGNGGLPPSLMHAFTGTKIFREFMIDGGYYPEGGMQQIPNALARTIQQNNGTLVYKRLVKKILTINNAVTGVKLDNDETIHSKYVISACDITQTFKTFLGKKIVGERIIDKLKHMEPAISTFTLYMGIDKPFKDLPEEGTNIWYLPHYDLDKMFNDVTIGSFDNFGGGAYMLRVSPDKKTILAFCITSFKTVSFWKQNKKKIAAGFLNRIEKLIPELKKHIAYFDAATPYTLYRYTLNYKGANYGWAPSLSQLFDPDFRQKTSIQGLYMTGHWTAQTHGIPGVAYLGYNTSKLILKQENMSS